MSDNVVVHPRSFAPVNLNSRKRRPTPIEAKFSAHLRHLASTGSAPISFAAVVIDNKGAIHMVTDTSDRALSLRMAWAMQTAGLSLLLKLLQVQESGQ